MTIEQRIRNLVQHASRNTMVPVSDLAEWLENDAETIRERAALSLDDVAARAEAEIFGGRKRPSPGAIRKWIREGKDGVRLVAFGHPYVVTEAAWSVFVAELRRKGEQRKARPEPVLALPQGADAADEIDAYAAHFSRDQGGR